MVRSLLALSVLARAVAEPDCKQADESTLLQGQVRHRRHSLQSNPSFDDPAAVVEWAANNHDEAETWVTTNLEAAASWVAANPDEAEAIFEDNPDLEELLPSLPSGAMTLKKLPGTTKCLDGTPAGYYSDTNTDSDVWVIFIKGGGQCSTAEECDFRLTDTPEKASSDPWESSMDGTGLLRRKCGPRKNPHFCNANHVYIPYCSGDTHRGQRTEIHEGFYMCGHLNFQAIIADLLATTQLGSASRVLLTGNSAGGIGTMVNADTLKSMLPTSVIVKASPTAGWFTPDETNDGGLAVSFFEDFSEGRVTEDEVFLSMWRDDQEWSDAFTGNCPASEGAKCMNLPVLASYVETPMLIFQNMWDNWHFANTYNDFPRNPNVWSDAQRSWAFYYAMASQASTAKVGTKDGNGYMLHGSIGHGPGTSAIDGHGYVDVLADWFYDDNNLPHRLVDACDTEESCLGLLGV